MREVVVVLPCDPAIATASFSRISSASIAARRMTGTPRARAASASGFIDRRTALEVTTTSTSRATFSGRCPIWMIPPSWARRWGVPAGRGETLGGLALLQVRAADAVAEVQEELGDAAHPDASDPDEVDLHFAIAKQPGNLRALGRDVRWNVRDSIYDNQ